MWPRRKSNFSEKSYYRPFSAGRCICTCVLFRTFFKIQLFHCNSRQDLAPNTVLSSCNAAPLSKHVNRREASVDRCDFIVTLQKSCEKCSTFHRAQMPNMLMSVCSWLLQCKCHCCCWQFSMCRIPYCTIFLPTAHISFEWSCQQQS
jgi:hypothetical protein